MFALSSRRLLPAVTRRQRLSCRWLSGSNVNTTLGNSSENSQETTHFGFRDVPETQKEELVGQVFHSVADKYDLMNDLMSGTLHRMWKDEFVKMAQPLVAPDYTTRAIDVAGGTGDIAFRLLEAANSERIGYDTSQQVARDSGLPPFSVVVCDINGSMLEVGKERAAERKLDPTQLSWREANAEKLPFEDNCFDLYTIAFGIRNCTHVDQVMREANRILKPGGRFMILEFSHLAHPLLQQAYDLYSFNVIPAMGEMITNDRESYQYFVESIRKFPKQRELELMMREQGFKYVRHTNMTFGIVAIHSGIKL